ncbi:MAG: glycosyltransferase family 2 protein [Bacteroidaceae bacterium]|nr:glycosyltransferase family 2 protein [Bacteroidaceae bacterium]
MPAVSVIIVSYKVRYYIEQCLNSVLRSVPDAEIFVVDNDSADGSVEFLRKRFPQVEVIDNGCNAGFGKANNIALAKATGRYVLFLNPDTVVAERTSPGCIEYMDAHPDTGAVGVRMQYGDGHFALESRRSLPTPSVAFWHMTGIGRLFSHSRVFAKYHLSYLDRDRECGIDVVSGAYMFIRKEALDKTGGFDEAFFMYGEDIDLSYRILQQGYKNCYLPLPIVHYKGESTNKTSYRYAKVFYDAMNIFFDKHFKRYSRLFAVLVKMVVGVKKISTYVGQNIWARRRMLADFRKNCLYVGRKETFADVERLLSRSDILINPRFVEPRDGVEDSLRGLMADDVEAVLFDTGVFSYDEVLDWMYARASENKRYTMGLYSGESGRLITEYETL